MPVEQVNRLDCESWPTTTTTTFPSSIEPGMEIRIDQVGRIVAGDDAGSYVKVIDDAHNTRGFLILTSSDQGMSNGFDNWVPDREALSKYFEESRWVIEWL